MNITTNWLDKYRPQKSADILGDKFYAKHINTFLDQFSDANVAKLAAIKTVAKTPKGKKVTRNTQGSKTVAVKKTTIKIKAENSKAKSLLMNPNLFIVGKNGIGKSLIVDILLQENSFEKITINLSNVVSTKKTKKAQKNEPVKSQKAPTGLSRSVDVVYASIASNKNTMIKSDENGQNTSINYIKSKSVLVFDDISTISNPKEKEAIKALIKMNNKLRKFPIIIISNTKHNKLVNEIHKMVSYNILDKDGKIIKTFNEIKMRAPEYQEIEKFVKHICEKEKLKLIDDKDEDQNIYEEIIINSQFDIRKLIYSLEELKLLYEDDEVNDINHEKFRKYQESAKMKDIDPNIYEATEILLNRYTGINDSITLYSEERATIPLMIHENYPLNIKLNYPMLSALKQMEIVCEISKNISESDKIDGIIYSHQCWNLQSIHGFYGCVMPSYHINKIPGKLSIKEKDRYVYAQDYTKTSTRKINNKVIRKSRENIFFKKMMTNDFLHITNILKKLLLNGEYNLIKEIIMVHNITCKEMESIINIDRITNPKFVLGTIARNVIKEMLKDAMPTKYVIKHGNEIKVVK